MKVHLKLRRSDKLSVMYFCPYVWVIEPFKVRNVSFHRFINFSDLNAGISNMCAPLSINNIVFEFLPIIWKIRLEIEKPMCHADKDSFPCNCYEM